MTKNNSENSTISRDDIQPMPQSERRILSAALATILAITANAAQRQFFGNIKLGSNTGETFAALFSRFGKNPEKVFSGMSHRLTLQAITQGAPMFANRAFSEKSSEPIISPGLTALLMATLGIGFEVSGMKKPIQEKAASFGKNDVDFLAKSPRIAGFVMLPILLRNNIYTNVVFGQNKENSLYKKVVIAMGAGIATNPIDNLINVMAYETAMAERKTSFVEIFQNTWKQFIAAEKAGHPYERFVTVLRNAFDGVPLRMVAVGGACLLLSREVGDVLEKGFSDYINSAEKFLHQLRENLHEKSGEKNSTSSPSSNPKTEQVTRLKELEDLAKRR